MGTYGRKSGRRVLVEYFFAKKRKNLNFLKKSYIYILDVHIPAHLNAVSV